MVLLLTKKSTVFVFKNYDGTNPNLQDALTFKMDQKQHRFVI